MLLFLKKKPEEPIRPEASAAGESWPPREFIPYYNHYNPHTLLTKNGEVLQVIKVSSDRLGFNYESGDSDEHTVRDAVRQAITESIDSDRFSLWIHTLRKRKPIRYGGTFNEPFSAHVHEQWKKKHPWHYQYYNEVYVTVLHKGQPAALLDKKSLKDTILPRRNRRFRHRYLSDAAGALDQAVSSMLERIRTHYSAQRLSIVERIPADMPGLSGRAIFYSEPMEFLGQLLNLRSEPFPLPESDLSGALCTGALTFGFNALSIRHYKGRRRFSAMLSLKQYREATPEAIDRVLQASVEIIISEALHFIPGKEALAPYLAQKELFAISGDHYSIGASGLKDILAGDRQRVTDYSEHQVSIMVLVDEFKHLDGEVARTQEGFAELGLITVREDIRLEECFWAQFPGNFEFLRRKKAIATTHVGGFARLNLFPNGTHAGNHWGDAVALVPTQVNSPYFFNFHHQDNGHTLLLDFNSFHDASSQVLLHFLLTSTLKYSGRLFVFDRKQSARLWFDKLGGRYHRFGKLGSQAETLAVNPFALEESPRNRAFLLAWCLNLIESACEPADTIKTQLSQAIDALFAGAPEQRSLAALIDQVKPANPALAEALAGRGRHAGWFGAAGDPLEMQGLLHAFDMDAAQAAGTAVPLFSYLLHRVIATLDGKPTVIVLHDAWDLIENSFLGPRLDSLLEMLTQNNAMMIFTTPSPLERTGTHSIATLMSRCATRLIVPDDIGRNYTSEALKLSAHDSKILRKMDRQKGDFLLQQNDESIALRINLDHAMDDIHAIFANDVKNLIAAGGPFASLPKYY